MCHQPSRDVTPLGHEALRQLALTVLEQHCGSEVGAEVLAAAAQRAYQELAHVSTPLIGQVGADALIGRALHLAQKDYPWLAACARIEPHARAVCPTDRQCGATESCRRP